LVGKPVNSTTPPDTASVNFAVDERTVIQLRSRMAGQKPGWERSLPVSCGFDYGKGFPMPAKVSSVDNKIRDDRQQDWHLTMSNKDGILIPGMAILVRLSTSTRHKALLVPENALVGGCIVDGRTLKSRVFIVDRNNAVQSREVEIGQLQEDGLRVVTKGLSGDDRVVLDPSKVQPGMIVEPKDSPVPSP